MKIPIRIIRTYHIDVSAEYGDTPDSLKAKAHAILADDIPDEFDETLMVMHGLESEYETLDEYLEATNPPEEVGTKE